jgi:hypothetical protein
MLTIKIHFDKRKDDYYEAYIRVYTPMLMGSKIIGYEKNNNIPSEYAEKLLDRLHSLFDSHAPEKTSIVCTYDYGYGCDISIKFNDHHEDEDYFKLLTFDGIDV